MPEYEMKKISLDIVKIFLKRRYYFLTSFLVFMSFPSFDIPILKLFPLFAWFCLVPVLTFIRDLSYKRLYIVSFFCFLIGSVLTFGWMRQFGKGAEGAEWIILAFLMPSISILWSARVIIAEYLSRRNESFRLLIYPAIWIAFDLVQSIGFLAFPWTYLGYTQYPFLPIVQISSIAGVFGVTFIIVLTNTALSMILYSMLKNESVKQRKIIVPVSITAVILLFSITFGIITLYSADKPVEKKMTVAMIQSCISPWDNWEAKKMSNLAELKRISDSALQHKVDFLIWSESATLEPVSFRQKYGYSSSFDETLLEYIHEKKIPLITGEIGYEPSKNLEYPILKNNAVLISADAHVVKSYSKIHLAPFGEWFPYSKVLPWVADLALSMGGSSFVPGNNSDLLEVNGFRFGMLICYEGMFFRLNREYVNKGADFLLNITNDGWSSSYGGHNQHFAAGVFRAVECGIPFVRAGNTGLSAVIDHKGHVYSTLPILNKGYTIADINTGRGARTIYSKIGDLFSYCIIIIAFMPAVWSIMRKKLLNKGD
jgi:apolipoprotein N-acyltransferase